MHAVFANPCPAGAAYLARSSQAGGPDAWTYYDVLSRPVLAVQQAFSADTYTAAMTGYDSSGRTSYQSEPYFTYAPDSSNVGAGKDSVIHGTSTQFDELGRPFIVTNPNGSTVKYIHDSLSTTVLMPTNGSGQIESRETLVNALGEVVEITDALGSTLTYQYSPTTDSVSFTPVDGSGAITVTSHKNALGQVTQTSDSDRGTWTNDINALGEVVQVHGPRGTCTRNDYDAQGRVWQQASFDAGTCGDIMAAETLIQHTFDTLVPGQLTGSVRQDNGATTELVS